MYTTVPSARCVAVASAMRSHSFGGWYVACVRQAWNVAWTCVLRRAGFWRVLKSVVHHAPVAMWPGSGVVLLRLIVQVLFANVAVACVACVRPHVWGFHVSRFSWSDSARSPFVFIVTVVLAAVCVVSAFVMRGSVASRVRMTIMGMMACLFIFWGSCLCVVLLCGFTAIQYVLDCTCAYS